MAVYRAANQAAMLALSAVVGDYANRTDVSATFQLNSLPPSTLGNWGAVTGAFLLPVDADSESSFPSQVAQVIAGERALQSSLFAPIVLSAAQGLLWSDEFTEPALNYMTDSTPGTWRTRPIEAPGSVAHGYTDYASATWLDVGHAAADANNDGFRLWWKKAGVSEPTAVTVTTTSTDYAAAVLYEINSTNVTPINQSGVNPSESTFATPSLTPTANGCLPLAFFGGGGAYTGPSETNSFTTDQLAASTFRSLVAAHGPATVGTSNPVTTTMTAANTNNGIGAVAVRRACVPPTRRSR